MEDLRGRDAAGPPDAEKTEPDVLDASSRSLSLVVSPPPPARMCLEDPAPLPEMPILLIDPTGPLVVDDDDFRNLLIDAAPVRNFDDEEEDFKRPEDEDRFD